MSVITFENDVHKKSFFKLRQALNVLEFEMYKGLECFRMSACRQSIHLKRDNK